MAEIVNDVHTRFVRQNGFKMGEYYRDADQLYRIYDAFLSRILQDDKIGPKMSRANLIIKFIYTDPDSEITIDLKNPPSKPGYHGAFYLGECDLKPDVWSRQSADHSHRFWHGHENPITSVATGKVKQGGNIVAMLKLLPVVRSAFKTFPVVLGDMNLEHLILTRK
ncbi:MAG: hypothetical protein Q8R92_02665 [Deltaproteobacteria bacterium]|nr:hypothetical protein [Deltaproteobacteria bacterium]